jgi:hypothetical protein
VGSNCYFFNISKLEMTWTSLDLYFAFVNKDVCIGLELNINFIVFFNLHFVVRVYCNLIFGTNLAYFGNTSSGSSMTTTTQLTSLWCM